MQIASLRDLAADFESEEEDELEEGLEGEVVITSISFGFVAFTILLTKIDGR